MQVPIASLLSSNLRTILPGALWAALILTATLCHAQSNLVLRAGGTTLEGNPTNGVILRIHDTASGMTLAPAPGLAEAVAKVVAHCDPARTILSSFDIGVMDVHYHHYGLGVWGREEVAWSDGLLWNWGHYDLNDPRTLDCQGVGFIGFFTPPYDARPNGRPT